LWAGEPVAAELVSDDFVGHWPNRDVHGPDELQVIVDETLTMFSDLTFVIEIEPFVDRDRVAARWIGTGATDDGPVRFTGNDILRFADGRFVEY
jgi:SnoaL-like domain